MTLSYVRHVAFIHRTWRIHMTHSYMCIHTCDTTHSYMWYDSFTHVTWLIHTCGTYRCHMYEGLVYEGGIYIYIYIYSHTRLWHASLCFIHVVTYIYIYIYIYIEACHTRLCHASIYFIHVVTTGLCKTIVSDGSSKCDVSIYIPFRPGTHHT